MRVNRRWVRKTILGVLPLALLAAAAGTWAQGGDPNECDVAGEEPDVIVGDLPSIQRWGSMSGMTSFSVATTSCNVGTCWLEWYDDQNRHPVIGANAYRLKDGRFEQVGQSWLKHGFFALSEELCDSDCVDTNGDHLGVNCSDPYSAVLNGLQGGLGPKFQVNPHTGDFSYPFFSSGQTGDINYKRLQIDNDDLDPNLNLGAQYWVEGQYVTPDDATAGNGDNNASYRAVDVLGSSGFYGLDPVGPTVQARPAIFAWKTVDNSVQLSPVRVPNEGLFWLGSQATDLGGGRWEYEYALHNLNSHRGAGRFRVPLPSGATVTDIGFHDVPYHSGEQQSGVDWQVVHEDGGPSYIEWWTETQVENPFANAVHWGTLYNFRFSIDAAPVSGDVTIGLWRVGTPDEMTGVARVPGLCDNDGVCDFGEDCDNCPNDCTIGDGACCGDDFCDPMEDRCSCRQDCGLPLVVEASCDDGIDDDCDGDVDCDDSECCGLGGCGNGGDGDGDTFASCDDCDDGNAAIWRAPGEVSSLLLDGTGTTQLMWSPPGDPGTISTFDYVALRSDQAGEWLAGATCLPTAGASAEDQDPMSPGDLFFYLVYARNSCPDGDGTLGQNSDGVERDGRECP